MYSLTNDATNGVVSLPIGSDGMLSKGTITKTGGAGRVSIESATKKQAIEDQKATHWATISDATQSAYVTDTARNRIVEMKSS